MPVWRHACPGYCLDAHARLLMAQLVRAVPSWVKGATHMAYLVDPVLEWGDSAADKCSQQVISCHPALGERNHGFVYHAELRVILPGSVVPVKPFRWGCNGECRQPNLVDIS